MILALLFTVSQFTTQDIDLRTSRDVAELLREAPGVSVEGDALLIRGADPQHTRILWNGIEIDEPYTGVVDTRRFSTVGVTRLEVAAGVARPESVSRGGAAGGVINLVTNPDRTTLRATGEVGGDELRLVNGTASYMHGVHSASVSLEALEAERAQRDTAHLLYRFTLPTFSVGVAARGVRHEDSLLLIESVEQRAGDEWQVGIPIAQTLGRFSYDLHLSQSERDDEAGDGFFFGNVTSTTRRARLVTRYGGLSVGAERKQSEANETTSFGPFVEDAEQNATAVFIEQQVAHALGDARLQATVGLRYDDYDTFGDELSPRVALAYSFAGNTIRAGFAEGFRAPTLRELYDPFIGDESLTAERSRTYEAGFSRGALHATAFASDYRDRIAFDVTEQRFVSGGAVDISGLELAYARTFGRLATRLSYTRFDRDEELLRIERNAGSLFLGYTAGRFRASAVVVHQHFTSFDANVQFDLGAFTPYVKFEDYDEDRRIVGGVRFVR
ncbi:MAG TPA: TonB-dependent receptor [Thermoanaerobaculia bacterium]|jgi:vitamin B12 transporter